MKIIKKIVSAVLVTGMLCSGVMALAADIPDNAFIRREDIYMDGRPARCATENNEHAYNLNYKGSVYVQLRGVAGWMGKEVSWDEASKTITLSGSTEPVFPGNLPSEGSSLSEEEYGKLRKNGVPVTERPDISVIIDGKPLEMKDAAGKAICPIVYNGTNYLPLRTVSEMLGVSVTYGSNHGYIYLRTPLTAEQETACKNYLETLQAQLALIEPYTDPHGRNLEELEKNTKTKITINDMETLKTAVKVCGDAINTIKNTPKPDVSLVDYFYERMQEILGENLPVIERVQKLIDSGADYKTCMDAYQNGNGAQIAYERVKGAVYRLECVILEEQ